MMPSRTPSPTLVLTPSSEVFSRQLNLMKPYTTAYITDYINRHNVKPKLDDSDNFPIPSHRNMGKASKKRVLFADSIGLDLVQVRYMTAGRDTPPTLSPEAFSALDLSKDKPTVPSLELDFQQPVSDYCHFQQSLEHNHVCLESVSVNENVIVGTIKVQNLAYHKSVLVHITHDGWISSQNVTAYYINNGLFSAQGEEFSSAVDTFSFTHEVPVNEITHRGIEFAICFRCNGQEYWDNHGNKNYRITVNDRKGSYNKDENALKKSPSLETNWTEFAIWRSLESDYTPYW